MPRPLRKAAPLGVVLDAASRTPLHRQIGEQVRRAILERRLAPGQRLPSSRLMASELDVARGTVLLAMDQLIAEGYVTAQAASGLSVATDLPDEMLTAPRGQTAGPAIADRATSLALSRRAARRHRRLSWRGPRIHLRAGNDRGHQRHAPEPVAAGLAGARSRRCGLDRGARLCGHARGAGAGRGPRSAGAHR